MTTKDQHSQWCGCGWNDVVLTVVTRRGCAAFVERGSGNKGVTLVEPDLSRMIRDRIEEYQEYSAGPGLDKPAKSGRSRGRQLFPLTL
ncbi:MAG: hypothetical protein HUU55_17505 [Myxococcales bacterium]|nr:hypothetical protein [Myxococcales bacterium]